MLVRNSLRRRRWIWELGAAAIALAVAGAVWWARDPAVSTEDHDRVVAELRASQSAAADIEEELAGVRAQLRASEQAAADREAESASLRAQIVNLDAEIAALRNEPETLSTPPDPAQRLAERVGELQRELPGAQARLSMWRAGVGDDARNGGEFDFATDSICTWITAEVMNDIVLLAQAESWTMPDRQGTFDRFGPDGCSVEGWWATGANRDNVWMTDGWPDNDAGLRIRMAPASAYGQPAVPELDADDFVAHPFLHESVTYAGLEYGSWASGLSVQLRVDGHADVLVFGVGVVNRPDGLSDDAEWPAWPDSPANRYEWLAFEIANLMLERMGWIPS